MMAKQGASTVVPKLRFPEFRNASGFGPTPLGRAFLRITNGKANAQDHVEGGIYPLFDRSEVVKASDEFAFSAEAVILPGEGMAFRPRHFEGKFNLHQRAYALMECQGHAKYFFYALDHAKDDLALKAVKSTVLSLRLPIIEQFVVYTPEKAEQQKIADCLTSLDEMIAAQGRKVEALKAHKRGLMQQLFPREGETRPRLRFPEFRNAPEWDETPLGELVDLLSGYPFDGAAIVEDSSGERLMRGINITEGAIRHSVEIDRYYLGSTDGLEKFRLEKNDLVIGMDGSKVGKNSALISESDAGALLIQRVARLRAASTSLINFIFHQIHSPRFHAYVDRINTSSGIPHISAKQIKEYPVHSTSEVERQHIADCLSSLDTQITAESHQLAALRTHEQGLMQQLFPVPEAG
jgi:type I restriction enzyme S subunit